MIGSRAQGVIDGLHATSTQQWVIRAVAFGCAVGALAVADVAAGSFEPVGWMALLPFALGAALLPDSHAGIVVILLVCWRWLAGVDDVRTPWVVLVAVGLLVFHAATALATIVPPGAQISIVTVVRWARRTCLIAAATALAWAVMVVLHARSAAGNAVLTFGAVATLVVAGLVGRARTLAKR